MYKTFFLVLVLVINCSAQECSTQGVVGMTAGSIELAAFSSSQNSYSHNFRERFSEQPRFAFGIWDLSYFNFGTSSVIKLQISGIIVTRISVNLTLQSQPAGIWRKVKLGYLASSKPELIMGSAQFGTNSLRGTTVIDSVENLFIPNFKKSIVRTFLNGFNVKKTSGTYQLQVSGSSVQLQKITVAIKAGPTTTVADVWYSFIIFSPPQVPFASYGGAISQTNYIGTNYKDIHNLVHYPKYALAGITTLKFELSFSLETEIDNDLVLGSKVTDNQIDFSFSYILFDIPPRLLCQNCPQVYPFQDKCVDVCPSDTYPFTYADRGIGCHRCSLKLYQVLNARKTGCDCVSGFSRTSDGKCEQNTSVTPVAPVTPVIPVTPVNPVTPINPPNGTESSCKSIPNSYWTGYRCACKVFYKFNITTGNCEKLIIKPPPTPQCQKSQFFDGRQCQCLPQHIKRNGVCQIIVCTNYSSFVNGQCICFTGYVKINNACFQICPQNSYRNSISNECLCNPNYQKKDGKCVEYSCPSNSEKVNGVCQCVSGFKLVSGVCSRCDEGFYWNDTHCVHPCGINEIYNFNDKKCQCKTGYGKSANNICEKCFSPYFWLNGYCVQCTLNSQYDAVNKVCRCDDGYTSQNNICVEEYSCKQNQYYDQVQSRCTCFSGLGRVNGICTSCPGGSTPDPQTQECRGCSANEILSGNACVCANGYGRYQSSCIICEDQGMFYLDGYCAECPVNRVWKENECRCKDGYTDSTGRCVQQCKDGQLIDANGICYNCPLLQIAQNGACVCQSGYQKGMSGICERVCSNNQYLIKGQCGTCVLGTVYNEQEMSCRCLPDYYVNSFGFCQKSNLNPVQCEDGKFYKENQGCVACPSSCKTCSSADKCQTCFNQYYRPQGNECVAICGDGKIIRPQEQCDDSNSNSGDGCSASCQVENGYRCNFEPSRCQQINPQPALCGNGVKNTNQQCEDSNTASGDGCSSACKVENGYICDPICRRIPKGIELVGDPLTNNQNVFIRIKTTPAFTFQTKQDMQKFIKYDFNQNAIPTSGLCIQQGTGSAEFTCLFIYPYGVPNFIFTVSLWFNKDGFSGNIDVPIDPLQSVLSTRSLF